MSRRERENRRLVQDIKELHQAKRGVYGSPRVHAELKSKGMHHSKKRVARLMRENDRCWMRWKWLWAAASRSRD